jgi:hypothetical protein
MTLGRSPPLVATPRLRLGASGDQVCIILSRQPQSIEEW